MHTRSTREPRRPLPTSRMRWKSKTGGHVGLAVEHSGALRSVFGVTHPNHGGNAPCICHCCGLPSGGLAGTSRRNYLPSDALERGYVEVPAVNSTIGIQRRGQREMSGGGGANCSWACRPTHAATPAPYLLHSQIHGLTHRHRLTPCCVSFQSPSVSLLQGEQ